MKGIDCLSLRRAQKLHPLIRYSALELLLDCKDIGIDIRFTDTFRSVSEQDKLFEKGRTTKGRIVTQAKGGKSYHNYGLALDFCLLVDGGKAVSWNIGEDINSDGKADWIQVVETAKKIGFESGMDWQFRDNPHLQITFGLSIDECYERFRGREVDEKGYIRI